MFPVVVLLFIFSISCLFFSIRSSFSCFILCGSFNSSSYFFISFFIFAVPELFSYFSSVGIVLIPFSFSVFDISNSFVSLSSIVFDISILLSILIISCLTSSFCFFSFSFLFSVVCFFSNILLSCCNSSNLFFFSQ